MKKEDIENQIKELEEQVKQKLRERGDVVREGGCHDNPAVDFLNDEIRVLESRIRELKELLLESDK